MGPTARTPPPPQAWGWYVCPRFLFPLPLQLVLMGAWGWLALGA